MKDKILDLIDTIKEIILIFLPAIIIITALVTPFFIGYKDIYDMDERIAYKTTSYEEQCKVKLIDIIKENGKEPIYKINIDNYGNVDIPESVYNEYLGNEYNAITMKKEELEIYIADSWLTKDFKNYETRYINRISYPWDKEAVQKFTNEETKEVINRVKEIGLNEDKWCETEFSFYCNDTGMSNGSCVSEEYLLNEGVIKYQD